MVLAAIAAARCTSTGAGGVGAGGGVAAPTFAAPEGCAIVDGCGCGCGAGAEVDTGAGATRGAGAIGACIRARRASTRGTKYIPSAPSNTPGAENFFTVFCSCGLRASNVADGFAILSTSVDVAGAKPMSVKKSSKPSTVSRICGSANLSDGSSRRTDSTNVCGV